MSTRSFFYIPDTRLEISEQIDNMIKGLDKSDRLTAYYLIQLTKAYEKKKREEESELVGN